MFNHKETLLTSVSQRNIPSGYQNNCPFGLATSCPGSNLQQVSSEEVLSLLISIVDSIRLPSLQAQWVHQICDTELNCFLPVHAAPCKDAN